jgi:hypothetical protein
VKRYDYRSLDFSLDRAEIRFSADTAIKNCVIITDSKRPRISSMWGHDPEFTFPLPVGGLRSAFTDSKGITYFVCGNTIYSTRQERGFENIVERGILATSQGHISWAESQSRNIENVYLYFTDGLNLYRINTVNQGERIQNLVSHLPYVNGKAELAIPNFLSFYQHRLLMTCKNSNQWFFSEIDPDSKERIFGTENLNFYSTETRADKLLRVIATDVIYLFGERTVEVWQPTGNDVHPYMSNTATNFGIGTIYPLSVIDYHNDVYFVATDNHIYGLSGGRMQKISAGDLSYYFSEQISGCFALQTNRGRYLAFKQVNTDTVLFNPLNNTFTLAPALNAIRSSFWLDGEFNGIADHSTITRQKETALAYNEDALIREIKTPIVFPDTKILARCLEFSFTISPLASHDERDNQIFISMSPDGGKTWRETRKRTLTSNNGIVREYAFGWGHNIQFKIVCSNKQMLDIHRICLFYDTEDR